MCIGLYFPALSRKWLFPTNGLSINTIIYQEYFLDHLKIGSSIPLVYLHTKFHQNKAMIFWVITVRNRQTDRKNTHGSNTTPLSYGRGNNQNMKMVYSWVVCYIFPCKIAEKGCALVAVFKFTSHNQALCDCGLGRPPARPPAVRLP